MITLDRRDIAPGETVVIAASHIADGVDAEMWVAVGLRRPASQRHYPPINGELDGRAHRRVLGYRCGGPVAKAGVSRPSHSAVFGSRGTALEPAADRAQQRVHGCPVPGAAAPPPIPIEEP